MISASDYMADMNYKFPDEQFVSSDAYVPTQFPKLSTAASGFFTGSRWVVAFATVFS